METNMEIDSIVEITIAYDVSDFIQCLKRGHTMYKTIIVSVAFIYFAYSFNLWFLELSRNLLLTYHIDLFRIVLIWDTYDA